MPRNVELDHDETMTPHVRSITLVRHGRTAYNAQHRLQGQIDIPLDEVGMWQVRQTASALRELYVDRHPEAACQLVVCSDLKRAAATAHAFADPLGLDVHPDVRVRERSFGDWEASPSKSSPNGSPRIICHGPNSAAASSSMAQNRSRTSAGVASRR